MIVTIRTAYLQAVREIIAEEEVLRECTVVLPDKWTVVLTCGDDRDYQQIRNWTSDAVGCGLIHGVQIARL